MSTMHLKRAMLRGQLQQPLWRRVAGLVPSLCTVQLFLGALREAEVERVNQRISQAVIETCLAMTIFRDEFNAKFVALFTVLSFIKVFHWLVQDRCALCCPCNIERGRPSELPWRSPGMQTGRMRLR